MSLNQQFFRKEARELMWYWIAALAVLLLGLMQLVYSSGVTTGQYNGFIVGLLWFAGYTLVHAVATYPFSSEFANNTMARLLAQPVRRAAIWNRKILLVGACLLALALMELFAVLAFHLWPNNLHEPTAALYKAMLIMLVSAFFSGPLMALLLRQGLTALLASMIMPFGVLLLGALIGELWYQYFHMNPAEEGTPILKIPLMWWILGGAWCAFAHLYARRRFLKLEV
ncbi:MAG: ABC transporter permease [Candidatus Sumerlaeaceae bacterium]